MEIYNWRRVAPYEILNCQKPRRCVSVSVQHADSPVEAHALSRHSGMPPTPPPLPDPEIAGSDRLWLIYSSPILLTSLIAYIYIFAAAGPPSDSAGVGASGLQFATIAIVLEEGRQQPRFLRIYGLRHGGWAH